MNKIKSNYFLNERGISLVEVIASVVLLTIILLSLFYMIVQSSKTTSTTEDIIDATYIAQTEMEELYNFAKNNRLDLPNLTYNSSNRNYINLGLIDGRYILEDEGTDLYVKVSLIVNNNYTNLTRVIIQVFDKKSSDYILKAQIENTLEWRK